MKTIQWVSVVAMAALAGCGSDPLVGTWGNSTQVVSSASSNTLTLAFKSGGKVTATGVTVFENSSPTLPGCTRTVITNGTYKETTSSSTVAITYTSGTTEAAGCLNASDANAPVALPDAYLATLTQTYTYGVTGATLSLATAAGAISYTKQ